MSFHNPKHRRAAAIFVAAATIAGSSFGMTAASAAETTLVPSITAVTPLVVASGTAGVEITFKGKNLTEDTLAAVDLGADPACAGIVPEFVAGGKTMTVTTPEGGCDATADGEFETITMREAAPVDPVEDACPEGTTAIEGSDPAKCAAAAVGTAWEPTKKGLAFVTKIGVDDVLLENGYGVDEDLRITNVASTGGQLLRIVATDDQTFADKPVVTVAGNAKLKLGVVKLGGETANAHPYIVVKTPKGLTANEDGFLSLDLTNKGVKTEAHVTTLKVAALPAVTGVSPNFGPFAAAHRDAVAEDLTAEPPVEAVAERDEVVGATVVIKGSGWGATPTADNTVVKICGATAVIDTDGKNDAKQLTVTAPAVPDSVETAETVCAVTVTVTTGEGEEATEATSLLSGGSVFTYIAH